VVYIEQTSQWGGIPNRPISEWKLHREPDDLQWNAIDFKESAHPLSYSARRTSLHHFHPDNLQAPAAWW